jgi:Flp pilus assembly pilin Flp
MPLPRRLTPGPLHRFVHARRRLLRDETGMSTAEYAVGTLAACGFAGVLWVVVHSGEVHDLLQGVVARALNLAP